MTVLQLRKILDTYDNEHQDVLISDGRASTGNYDNLYYIKSVEKQKYDIVIHVRHFN